MFKGVFFLLLSTVLTTALNAQETIDVRLLRNRGKQAEQAFHHNRNGYNYFLFELDKSHYITQRSTLTTEELSQLQPAAQYVNMRNQMINLDVARSETFNFYEYGIRIQRDHRIYIALENDYILVFYAQPELSQLFLNSPYNVK